MERMCKWLAFRSSSALELRRVLVWEVFRSIKLSAVQTFVRDAINPTQIVYTTHNPNLGAIWIIHSRYPCMDQFYVTFSPHIVRIEHVMVSMFFAVASGATNPSNSFCVMPHNKSDYNSPRRLKSLAHRLMLTGLIQAPCMGSFVALQNENPPTKTLHWAMEEQISVTRKMGGKCGSQFSFQP